MALTERKGLDGPASLHAFIGPRLRLRALRFRRPTPASPRGPSLRACRDRRRSAVRALESAVEQPAPASMPTRMSSAHLCEVSQRSLRVPIDACSQSIPHDCTSLLKTRGLLRARPNPCHQQNCSLRALAHVAARARNTLKEHADIVVANLIVKSADEIQRIPYLQCRVLARPIYELVEDRPHLRDRHFPSSMSGIGRREKSPKLR